MWCQFLLYSKVNQLYIYIYPLFFQILFLYRSLQSIKQSSMCYTVGPCLSIFPKLLIYPSLPLQQFAFNTQALKPLSRLSSPSLGPVFRDMMLYWLSPFMSVHICLKTSDLFIQLNNFYFFILHIYCLINFLSFFFFLRHLAGQI